jgi:hypothetical protein
MILPQLTADQWQAAQEAARRFTTGDPASATDRAAYRNARARLVDLLPDDAEANEVIKAAVRWNMRNDIAASLAMIPAEAIA